MSATPVITTFPKIHKHVDACAFNFRNDTGRCLETGEHILVNELQGITNVPIGIDECGQAQLLCGPVVGYRMYLENGLDAEICVGDPVYHPTIGSYLGVAIHGGPDGASKGLSEPAAVVGAKCVYFLGLKPSSEGGNTPPGTGEPAVAACASFVVDELPSVFPTSDPTSGSVINAAEVMLSPTEGSMISVDEILAGMDKSNLPNGYAVKFHNVGAGQITMTAQGTGDTIPFATNEYVCLTCCDGEWKWM